MATKAEPAQVKTPWDERTIELLSIYQQGGIFHPYTCGKCSRDPDLESQTLIPTRDGWRCPFPVCDYKQDWCHESTLIVTENHVHRRGG